MHHYDRKMKILIWAASQSLVLLILEACGSTTEAAHRPPYFRKESNLTHLSLIIYKMGSGFNSLNSTFKYFFSEKSCCCFMSRSKQLLICFSIEIKDQAVVLSD